MKPLVPGQVEIEILRVATRLLHDQFPHLPLVSGWPEAVAHEGDKVRDALISNWNASGDAYVGAYFDRGNRYFAVILETRMIERDGKWAIRVCKTAIDGGTTEVEEDLLICNSSEELYTGLARNLSTWRKPYLIHMSEDCAAFMAMSPEELRRQVSEGTPVANAVAEVMAESEEHALEVFRGMGPRSAAFNEMVDRGLDSLPRPPTP